MQKYLLQRLAALAAATTLGCTHATAADYPSKTVQYVVPFGAGPTDLLARSIASCASQQVGQPVIVVNKPGASGLLAASIVKQAAPDGHTLMLGTSATVTELVTRKAPEFDVRRDLQAITKIAYGVQGVYVNALVPVKTIAELIAHARAHPGELNYATVGISSVNHISTEALSQVAGISMVHVPYPAGTGALLAGLMAGDVQVVITDIGAAQAAVDSGKVRLIGLLTKERLPARPGVPAVVEVLPDMAGYIGTLWYGLFAPAKAPSDIIEKIHKTVIGCLATAPVRTAIRNAGFEESQIVADTPAEFKSSIAADVDRLSAIVRQRRMEIR